MVAPSCDSEAIDPRVRYLAQVWSEMLGGPVAPGDNFFVVKASFWLPVN